MEATRGKGERGRRSEGSDEQNKMRRGEGEREEVERWE